MKEYGALHLVKNEDLNHHSTLFAAKGAAWLIEAGFTAVACEHGNTNEIVLRNIQNVSYSRPVQKGSVVNVVSRVVYAGSSSIMVCVIVKDAMSGEVAIEGYLTFVTIQEGGKGKLVHNIVLDDTQDEEELRQRANAKRILASR